MSYRHTSPDFNPQRRSLLRAGTAAAGLSALTPLFSVPLLGAEACQPPIPKGHEPSNGGSCPFPIPWLDKNGNHNQMPKADVELSHIFHFQGKLGRCAGQRYAAGKSTRRLEYFRRYVVCILHGKKNALSAAALVLFRLESGFTYLIKLLIIQHDLFSIVLTQAEAPHLR